MRLGVFQLWMVPSTPPLKICSPVALMVTLSTAPLGTHSHTSAYTDGPLLLVWMDW